MPGGRAPVIDHNALLTGRDTGIFAGHAAGAMILELAVAEEEEEGGRLMEGSGRGPKTESAT